MKWEYHLFPAARPGGSRYTGDPKATLQVGGFCLFVLKRPLGQLLSG